MDMYGGKITGGHTGNGGGGAIALDDVNCVFNMYGGEISGNRANRYGGAIFLNGTLQTKKGGTVNLYGGTISNNHSNEWGGAVYLSISCTLNMTGAEICNNTAKEEGGAVHVYGENATFNFSGGTITGNEAVDGGAVFLNQELSTLNMTGGEISGNKATRNGGALYMFRETSTLNLSGGTIKNNTADSSGGAVYFNTTSDGKIQGILNISGNPVVKDNTVSDKANNISLKSGKTLSIVGAMTGGASVGITTESTEYPVVFSNAYDNDYTGYFFADDENAHVNYNSEKKLELAAGEPHTHTYDQQVATADYKASDATCTAKATYYKSCICGAKGTETFESGELDASNHTGTLSGWQTDSNKHRKVYSCCSAKVDEGVHTASDWITDTAATATTVGTKHKECITCGYVMETGTIPATGYTITFDANGGSVTPESAKTNAEGKLTSLSTPTRSGSYSFDGWYTAANSGNEITIDYVFSADTTVHAHWRYTGGSGVSTYAITVDSTKNGDVATSHKTASKGTNDTTFSPDAPCTRAQIVTFLYRCLGDE